MAHAGVMDWSVMDLSDVPENLQSYLDVPASALVHSRREQLGLHLNIPRHDFSERGLLKDWRGLAERLGFSPLEIDNFGLNPGPTSAVLGRWMISPDSKMGHLLEALCAIERIDVLRNVTLMSLIEADCIAYTRQEQRRREEEAQNAINPVQVDHIESSDAMNVDEYDNITIGETPGIPEKFHAFLCYTSADFPFVRQMIDKLEGEHGLKLCVPDRDLVAGGSTYTIIAKLIRDRCEKMIIVLSPEFKHSVQCDFQTKFGLSLSPGAKEKKLIPVVYKPCEIPDILNHICLLDYTRCDVVDWFWGRLANSLKKNSTFPPHNRTNQRHGPRSRAGPHTAPIQSSRPIIRPAPHHHTAPYRVGGAAQVREGRIGQTGPVAAAAAREDDLLTNQMQMQHFAMEPENDRFYNDSSAARSNK